MRILTLATLALSLTSATALAQTATDFTGAGNSQLVLKGKKTFNPDIGINLLGFYSRSNEPSNLPNGFRFQEAELQFTADVDPYLRAITLFAVRPQENPNEHGFVIDPEELFIETISLPRVILKLGKFRAAMGKHNLLHTHAYPFIDAPLIVQRLLGEEGLNEVGLSASVLMPTSWFMELTAQAIAPRSETLFNAPDQKVVAGVAHLRNLWELGESTTIEFGLSGSKGRNEFHSDTNAYGSHLTLKWRPSTGGKYRSLAWTTEYLGAHRGGDPEGEPIGGIASWVQYQFAERWWIQARGEVEGLPRPHEFSRTNRKSVLLGFLPTEFSGFRLQYDHAKLGEPENEHRVALQWNVSIGAHPAHGY